MHHRKVAQKTTNPCPLVAQAKAGKGSFIMKRHANLWHQVHSTSNLVLAFRKARRGKVLRQPVIEFSKQIRINLRELQRQLQTQFWHHSEYRQFYVYEPKERLISAASFGDRVVHHALMNIMEPVLEKFQIHHSYACRVGKGTHAAVAQSYANQRRYGWFLKMDIRKYFPSIRHDVLLRLVGRHFKDKAFLLCLERIVDHGGENGLGLPIGNLTSQHLANLHLSYLDHFVLQTLAPCAYVRYMDDFVLWSNCQESLRIAQQRITQYLDQVLHLTPKHSATELLPVRKGLLFLGCRILPNQVRLSQRSLYRLRRHIRQWYFDLQYGVAEETLTRKAASVMGWTRLAHSHALRSRMMEPAHRRSPQVSTQKKKSAKHHMHAPSGIPRGSVAFDHC
jgi:retron-type reverse transcriptase